MAFDNTGRFIPSALQQPPTTIASKPMNADVQQQHSASVVAKPFNTAMNSNVAQPAQIAAQPMQTQQYYQPQAAPQQQQQYYRPQYQQQQYQQPQYQQQYQQPQQSVVQSVNNRNPQSVSNFLSALGQVGAGGNNNMFNGQGQHGQSAQAGFGAPQQQLGSSAYQGYTGPMQSQMNYQQNGAQLGGMASVNNYARQGQYGNAAAPMAHGGGNYAGGQGGSYGQPQWQVPQAWGQALNAPAGTPGSAFDAGHGYEQLNSPASPALGGSFYSNGIPGAGGKATETMEQRDHRVATTPWVGDPSLAPDTPYNPNTGYATSDENAKTNIKSGKGELQEFLDALGVYSYNYKDPDAHGHGSRISPMAQEIESTVLGKDAIFEHNGYKAVNYGKLAGTQLAATALLNDKIKMLERKLSKAVLANVKSKRK